MIVLPAHEPVAVALAEAIHAGDAGALAELIERSPGLASAGIRNAEGALRTPLHVATDWPGYFPNGPVIVRMLLDGGANPSVPMTGGNHAETPLHWAASSDDVDVAAVLIAGGADLEARGASIAGGTPLDDAVGYGCWHVARLLVERGARVDKLWHAAALGMRSRVDELLATNFPPSPEVLDEAFWQACHGGQRRIAEHLFALGAKLDSRPHYARETPLDIAGARDTRRDSLVTWLRAAGAKSAR